MMRGVVRAAALGAGMVGEASERAAAAATGPATMALAAGADLDLATMALAAVEGLAKEANRVWAVAVTVPAAARAAVATAAAQLGPPICDLQAVDPHASYL